MKGKVLRWVPYVGILVLAVSIGTLAQAPTPVHFSGLINDDTPVITALTPEGPWEIRGHWSLDLKGQSGKADFSAYMTMELSDYGVSLAGADPTMAKSRSAHTHHFVMTDATVSVDPSDTSNCPANSPANTTRFVVNGTAKFISANGNSAPFEKAGPSMLQVCISGGTDGTSEVEYSNMTLVITGPAATKHFGSQPIHGVVRLARSSDDGATDKQ